MNGFITRKLMTGGNVTKKQYKQLLLDHFTERLDKLTVKELKELAARHT
jgi:hypothetical protein